MHEKMVRWFHLIEVLPSFGKGMTTQEVRRALSDLVGSDVPLRTVQRDLNEIEKSGLVSFVKDKDLAGVPTIRADAGFRTMDTRVMSPAVAMTLLLVLRQSAALLPPAMLKQLDGQRDRAEKVLKLGAAPGKVQWLDKVRSVLPGYTPHAPMVSESVMEAVYSSLAQDTMLRATYRTPEGKESTRDYSLLGLLWRPPHLLLLTSLDPELDPFTLAMTRISSAESIAQDSVRPNGFELDEFLARHPPEFTFDPTEIRILVRCSPELGQRWRETPLGNDQSIEEDAEWRVSATVPNTISLRAYLLGWDCQLEVLEPADLREWMRDKTDGMARRYKS